MPTKETPSFIHETSHTHENDIPGEGSLRYNLLTAPEYKEAFVTIPRGTIAIEMNSDTLTAEDFFAMSDTVTALAERPNRQWSEYDNARTLRAGSPMFLVDLEAKHQRERGGEANITLLYEGESTVGEGQLHIPSAVLVHEKLSVEQLQRLRDILPPQLPLIDAQTNELLDAVGAEEREEGRSQYRLFRQFGEFAVGDRKWDDKSHHFSSFYDDIMTHNANTYSNREDYTASSVDFEWLPFDDESEGYGNGNGYYYEGNETSDAQQESRSNDSAATEGVNGTVPESEEVRSYRERTEQAAQERHEEHFRQEAENRKMVDDAAKEKFGRSLDDLSDQEKVSLRREAVKKYHPDVANDSADSEKFNAFEQILK